MKRRTFVLTAAATGALAVAGCSGNESDDDSTDGADGDDGGSDDGATDGGTTDDDGTNSDDGTAEDDGTTDDETDDSDGEQQAGPVLGESFQWADSFVAELRLDSQQFGDITIRTNGGNYQQTIETQQGTFEIYNVDDVAYVVRGGSCFRNPDQGIPEPDAGIDPQDESDVVSGQPSISPSGRDTIDGTEMYVYELTEEDVTLYVSVDAGTLRRVEFPQGRIDYHSWGEVDPIELPDSC